MHPRGLEAWNWAVEAGSLPGCQWRAPAVGNYVASRQSRQGPQWSGIVQTDPPKVPKRPPPRAGSATVRRRRALQRLQRLRAEAARQLLAVIS